MIKVSFIFICFLSALKGDVFGKKDSLNLKAALFFTFISDIFLILIQNYYIGITTFCVVHILYSLRYRGYIYVKKLFKVLLILILYSFFLFHVNLIYKITFIYFICFLFSLNASFHFYIQKKPQYKNVIIIPVGMALFALCDICVAISHLESFKFIHILIWVFYAPAQLLLSLSNKNLIIKKR